MGICLSPLFHSLLSKLILSVVPKLFMTHLEVNVAENKIDLSFYLVGVSRGWIEII